MGENAWKWGYGWRTWIIACCIETDQSKIWAEGLGLDISGVTLLGGKANHVLVPFSSFWALLPQFLGF